jgi:O-succinylbenzoate synthase
MNIRRIALHHIRLPLKAPFAASYGTYTERETILVEMEDDTGATGWGECVAFAEPWYSEETVETAWHVMGRFLVPAVLERPVGHPSELADRFAFVRRNRMAKAGLEQACWDLYAKRNGLPLAKVLGGVRHEVEAGVAVGLQDGTDALLAAIEGYLAEGYRRIKIKIKPGLDLEPIAAIRRRHPDLPLMADANSAYTLDDIPRLKALDAFDLLMIEQPLDADDIVDHAVLQREIATPVCLDESIAGAADARRALDLGSCRIINVKAGRVGGLAEAKRIHDLCEARGVPVWCGGMLESGVGRAHNIALASLPNFTIPGDLSSSSRYWHRDVVHPDVTVKDGKIQVPDGPGIGFDVDREFVARMTVRRAAFGSGPS